ncbi:hypothetical protein PUV54_06315 [Hyphococcus flavus]|uniref:Uncharacterized protein n=1 Tax=Hyphococcus flavus TaxID=1866326 RepID=A0AAE9ZFE5_9PROT|nr:hypothetical protein [Hyphococcus flavus]WDI32810.1 hypothetical protein PUV54_06315 [Hyphococcus flavus]
MTNDSDSIRKGEEPRNDATKDPEEAENSADTLRVGNSDTASDSAEKLTTEEVRQGHTGDHVRYILAASVAGAVILITIAYLYFAP